MPWRWVCDEDDEDEELIQPKIPPTLGRGIHHDKQDCTSPEMDNGLPLRMPIHNVLNYTKVQWTS